MTPFHALYTASELRKHTGGSDRLLPALASANMKVYPFQIAAAMFALRSPYLKGAILADEGSLGKTYEALLVISQMWYEGKEKILLVVPTSLLRQWQGILNDNFSLPYVMVDGDVADFEVPDAIVLTTYDYAAANLEAILLTDEQCRKIMSFPVVSYTASGERIGEQNRHLREQSRHELDKRIDTAVFIRRATAETDGERKDEIDRLTEQARLQKLTLTRDIERLRREIKQSDIDKGGGIADRIDTEKRRAAMTKDIKQREQSVFLDGLKIDVELEEEVNKLTAGLTAKVTRMFAIRVKGAYQNG